MKSFENVFKGFIEGFGLRYIIVKRDQLISSGLTMGGVLVGFLKAFYMLHNNRFNLTETRVIRSGNL